MNDLVALVKDLGFPIFVSVYMLVRLDRMMVRILYELKNLNGRSKQNV